MHVCSSQFNPNSGVKIWPKRIHGPGNNIKFGRRIGSFDKLNLRIIEIQKNLFYSMNQNAKRDTSHNPMLYYGLWSSIIKNEHNRHLCIKKHPFFFCEIKTTPTWFTNSPVQRLQATNNTDRRQAINVQIRKMAFFSLDEWFIFKQVSRTQERMIRVFMSSIMQYGNLHVIEILEGTASHVLMVDSIKIIATNPEFHIDTLQCFGNKTLMTKFDQILRSQKREKFPNVRNHYFSANFQFSSFLFILADICKTQTVEWHNRREENIEFPQQKHRPWLK